MTQKLRIEIITSCRDTLCKAGCGNDWSQPEVQNTTKRLLRQKFGEEIMVDYKDITNSKHQVKSEDKFPILMINDHIRLSGPFDERQLLEIIETQLELGK